MFFCIFVSDGDFAGSKGEQGCLASAIGIGLATKEGRGGRLASAMGILPAAKESRGVWRQYAFILSCGEFGGILILMG